MHFTLQRQCQQSHALFGRLSFSHRRRFARVCRYMFRYNSILVQIYRIFISYMNIKKRAVKKVNPEFRSCISAGINKLYHYKCRRVRMLKKEHFKHATKLSRINTYYICRIVFKWCCLWASIKSGTLRSIPEHEKINLFFYEKIID